ncbi:AraC family transcriptional regulator [Psychrobacter sp. I-STPA6b]|uniref:AraC family transcriptional regulator n=1 Tax=Psychrobacter sp. I-STPA6b TaxID=2585718 RepID=UPI001D0CCCC7|nr:AraC family transcriptional regulator [Psychrobacter sp. I-STPA6b]
MDALSMLLKNVHLYETKYYCLKGNDKWSYSLARKDTIIFYLVLKGGFCIEIDGIQRQASTGDIIMIPHAKYHVSYAMEHHGKCAKAIDDLLTQSDNKPVQINDTQGMCNADLVLVECSYDKEVTRPLLSALPDMLPEHGHQSKTGRKVLDMGMEFLSIESREERLGKSAMINRLASLLMIECLRAYIESLPDATDSWLRALKDPYLAKALAVMHNSPEQSWTINQLAEIVGMSRSSFAERFKQVVGMPPLTYLIDYRMRLAARYLRLQQNSISRISELVGYSSDSTFSQAFKRVYGISPRSYRQKMIEEGHFIGEYNDANTSDDE